MIRELLIDKLTEACNLKWTQDEFNQFISYLCNNLNDRVHYWYTGHEQVKYETDLMEIIYFRDTSASVRIYGSKTFRLGIDGILQ